MLKWHKPIKHVANVYLLFFTPYGVGDVCVFDGSKWDAVHTHSSQKATFRLIRKVLFTLFVVHPRPTMELMWFLCFWKVATATGLAHKMRITLTFFPSTMLPHSLCHLMNNLVNQILLDWKNSRTKGNYYGFMKSPFAFILPFQQRESFPSFALCSSSFVFPKIFIKCHTRESWRNITQ